MPVKLFKTIIIKTGAVSVRPRGEAVYGHVHGAAPAVKASPLPARQVPSSDTLGFGFGFNIGAMAIADAPASSSCDGGARGVAAPARKKPRTDAANPAGGLPSQDGQAKESKTTPRKEKAQGEEAQESRRRSTKGGGQG